MSYDDELAFHLNLPMMMVMMMMVVVMMMMMMMMMMTQHLIAGETTAGT